MASSDPRTSVFSTTLNSLTLSLPISTNMLSTLACLPGLLTFLVTVAAELGNLPGLSLVADDNEFVARLGYAVQAEDLGGNRRTRGFHASARFVHECAHLAIFMTGEHNVA